MGVTRENTGMREKVNYFSLLPEQKPELPWHASLEKPVKGLKQNQGILEESITIANHQ